MYNPIITHDIDRLYKWKFAKAFIGEIYRKIKGKSSWKVYEMINSYLGKTDPFNNLLQVAEYDLNAGLTPVFYFMTTNEKHPKNINDYKIAEIENDINSLISLGCEIGLHSGYLCAEDKSKILQQKLSLEEVTNSEITHHRFHYFNYSNPISFEYLAELNFKTDSSIYPTNKYDSYIMHLESGKSIKQIPLVFMETHHMNLSNDEILRKLENALKPAKENNGEVMILWHNNNISNDREIGLYKEALQIIKKP